MTATLVGLLADASLRSTVLALLVGFILRAGRIRDAAARHTAWTVALLGMLLMPLLSAVMPSVEVPVVRFGSSETGAAPGPIPLSAAPRHRDARAPAIAISRTVSPRAILFQRAGPDPKPAFALNPEPTIVSPTAWPVLAIAVWALGVLLSALRLFLGWRAVRRLLQGSRPIPAAGEGAAIAAMTSRRVLESAGVSTPVAAGLLTPAIVLPSSRLWTNQTLRAVLAHEVAHIERGDLLVAFLARINRCVFWFHPVAWALVSALAVEAEHASDECAMRVVADRRRYADILIDLARAAHDRGGRVLTLAMVGRGRFERRLDRVLSPHAAPLSRSRAAIAGFACVSALALVAACRQRSAGPSQLTGPEEQRQHQISAELTRLTWDRRLGLGPYEPISRAELTDREEAVRRAPEDLNRRRVLLLGYWLFGLPPRYGAAARVPSVPPPGDPTVIAARREQIFWLIDHHPESELAGSTESRLFLSDTLPTLPADPEGYARAKALWLAHADRPDATSAVLGNASYFFEASEPQTAERLLFRARAIDPGGPWSIRLGRLYAITLTAARLPESVSYLLPRQAPANNGAGITTRRRLNESQDAVMLTAAGWFLAGAPRYNLTGGDPREWAESCLVRALQLNPMAIAAHTELLQLRDGRVYERERQQLWPGPTWKERDDVERLPEAERFDRLPELAQAAVAAMSEGERWNDPNLDGYVMLARRRAKQYADEMLLLAPKYKDNPRFGMSLFAANLTLGSLALANGDKTAAVAYLHKASESPACEDLVYRDIMDWRWSALPRRLVKQGEREAVAAFLDRMARTNLVGRSELREKAAAIRRGDLTEL